MRRYKNTIVLKSIGTEIRKYRIKKNLEIEDVSEMTGLSYNTINNIENGEETYFSNIIEVCFALEIHPKELFDIPLIIKPRFELSATRLEKSRLTSRIKIYVNEGFFKAPRKANDIVQKLKDDFTVEVESKNVSTVLARLAKNNILKITKEGNKNLYSV